MHRSEKLLTKVLTNTSLSDRIFSKEAKHLSNPSQSWLFFALFFIWNWGLYLWRDERGRGFFLCVWSCVLLRAEHKCNRVKTRVYDQAASERLLGLRSIIWSTTANLSRERQPCQWHSAPNWPGIGTLEPDTKIHLYNLVVQAQLCQCRFPHYKWIRGVNDFKAAVLIWKC